MTTIKNVHDPADATGHKAEPADPTTSATKLTGAFRPLDQCMASTRDLEVGTPHSPQSTDREPDFPAMTLVDEASEHFAPAREGVIPLDSPVAHLGSSDAEEAANPPPPQTTLREQSRRPRGYLTEKWRPIVRVLLPFAVGFYLTNLFRTINALISDQLTSDLALGAADLGLLTSVYFLTFAAAQIPIGILLDRYGPRRVESALLVVAAGGAVLFGASQGFVPLVLARALIGLGVAAALTAGVKAIVLWFPKERVALVNGYLMMLGTLGAVTATVPAELLLAWTGWRGLFDLLAVATAATAVMIYFVVPEAGSATSASNGSESVSLKTVYSDPRFWRLAPISATCAGTAWALQGLWAAPWLTDVEGIDRASVIRHLFIMAVALTIGALLLGTAADRLSRRGIGPQTQLAVVTAVFIAAQLALVLRLPLPSDLPWSVVGAVGAVPVLSYAILAEYFPKELAGRANGALTLFHFGGAFVLQYAIGLVLQQWTSRDGHYPAIAYQVAFGINLGLQVAALAWFELPRVRRLGSTLVSRQLRSSVRHEDNLVSGTSYQQALRVWVGLRDSARVQATNWRLAALGSTGLSALLALTLAIAAGRASVTPYIIEVDRLHDARAVHAAPGAPSDAQIAYLLARFVSNIRSLSVDPIVVRSNWLDALDYVTDRGAQTLNDYARDADPFTKIGVRAITVEVIYVVRASSDSFEIRWREQTYQDGTIVKTETFTSVATIILSFRPTDESMSKNPLGLYIRALNWSADHSANQAH